jgi:hypothetical protein
MSESGRSRVKRLADRLPDLLIAPERVAQEVGQGFPMGDARLEIGVPKLPPDRDAGDDRDDDRRRAGEQRWKS